MQCALERGFTKNQKINGQESVAEGDVKSTVESFTFVDGDGDDAEKLIPKNTALFKS